MPLWIHVYTSKADHGSPALDYTEAIMPATGLATY